MVRGLHDHAARAVGARGRVAVQEAVAGHHAQRARGRALGQAQLGHDVRHRDVAAQPRDQLQDVHGVGKGAHRVRWVGVGIIGSAPVRLSADPGERPLDSRKYGFIIQFKFIGHGSKIWN
ncbi:hypothetical protein D3C72_1782850 [compost metagenome]